MERSRLFKKNISDSIRVIKLIVAQKLHGADHTYTLMPYRLTITGEFVQDRTFFVEQPTTKELVTREVNEIPVVNIF